jgi:hypothetical protein
VGNLLVHANDESLESCNSPGVGKTTQGETTGTFDLWQCPQPGEVELPRVVKETSGVETAVVSVFSSNTLIHSNSETVLEQLNRCDAVHFACHGPSSHIDPFDSSLIL